MISSSPMIRDTGIGYVPYARQLPAAIVLGAVSPIRKPGKAYDPLGAFRASVLVASPEPVQSENLSTKPRLCATFVPSDGEVTITHNALGLTFDEVNYERRYTETPESVVLPMRRRREDCPSPPSRSSESSEIYDLRSPSSVSTARPIRQKRTFRELQPSDEDDDEFCTTPTSSHKRQKTDCKGDVHWWKKGPTKKEGNDFLHYLRTHSDKRGPLGSYQRNLQHDHNDRVLRPLARVSKWRRLVHPQSPSCIDDLAQAQGYTEEDLEGLCLVARRREVKFTAKHDASGKVVWSRRESAGDDSDNNSASEEEEVESDSEFA